MSDTIPVPASFRFWMDDANAIALETIADQESIPGSLSWNEAREFYNAKFAYTAAKNDFYNFLLDVWDATWGGSFAKDDDLFEPQIASEYTQTDVKSPDEWLSPDTAWGENTVYRIFKLRGHPRTVFVTCAWYDVGAEAVKLRFYFIGAEAEEDSFAEQFELPDSTWQQECNPDGGVYRDTAVQPPLSPDTESLDTAGLRAAACSAVRSVRERFAGV